MGTERSGRVVVGLSDSITGLGALRVAVDEARRRGMPLHVVRVWNTDGLWGTAGIGYVRVDQVQLTADAVVRAFGTALGVVPMDVRVVAVAVEGATAAGLVGYATRDGDLLVVGEPDRGVLRRLFGRSVAQRCVARAVCPVLAVPPAIFARSAHRLARQLRHDMARLGA